MIHAAVGLVLLLAQEPEFAFEKWGAWHSFGEGSSATLELTKAKNPSKYTLTLTRRGPKTISVQEVNLEGDRKTVRPPNTWEKAMSRREPVRYADGLCFQCQKHKTGELSWSRDKAQAAGREFDCIVEKTQWYRCDGKVAYTSRVWYSKEVPGWIVKSEADGGPYEDRILVAFDAKAPPAGEVEVEPFDVLVFRKRGCDDPELLRMAKLCKDRAAEVAAAFASEDNGLEYQYNLLHLLAHIGTDDALKTVKMALETGRTRNIKDDAMYVIGHFDRDDVRDYLVARLSLKGAIYTWLPYALVQAKAKKAVEPLLKFVEAGEGIERAAPALGELGDAKTGERLAAVYPKVKLDLERLQVASAAAKLGVKRMEAEIRKLQTSNVSFVRTGAGDYFLALGDLSGLDPFVASFSSKDDLERNSGDDYDQLLGRIPVLPKLGKKVGFGTKLSEDDRKQLVAWLSANRSKLVFDPKKKQFTLK